jgi:hypothetical protein
MKASVSPKQAKLMKDTVAGKPRPGGGAPSVKVAKEFVRADRFAGKGARSSSEIVDHKREMDTWAKGTK